MTSKRNYRQNMSMDQAIEELYRCSGSQFDPNVVEYFARSIIDFSPNDKVFSKEYLENLYQKDQTQQ